MIFNLSICASCFYSDNSLKSTLQFLLNQFNNSLLLNLGTLVSELLNLFSSILVQDTKKDFQTLLLEYNKRNKIIEFQMNENNSICEINQFLSEQKVWILFSEEQKPESIKSNTCSQCLIALKEGILNIEHLNLKYNLPQSQEFRCCTSDTWDLLRTQIIEPLSIGSSKLELYDIFLGTDLVYFSENPKSNPLTDSEWIYTIHRILKTFEDVSLYKDKKFIVHTLVKCDKIDKVAQYAREIKRTFLKTNNIQLTFKFYKYQGDAPRRFTHDRYLFSENIGISSGIGFDLIIPDRDTIRRESQFTVIGNETILKVINQHRGLTRRDRILGTLTV
ncbi:hypothetical protein CEE45_10975 [Candidatus Heimdallarchaeota archaeon B3_Heim]|nr:MAG: hypothetical protein CEE45_10975 [Candidatus Heimdallarchaeota archaeon B3_Heim]